MQVTFGDVLATRALDLAKMMGAQLGVDLDPEAVEVILRSTYVDDTAGGGPDADIHRYMGH